MDYCSCLYSNLIVFLLTIIVGFVATVNLVYRYRNPIIHKIKSSVLAVLRDASYGASDMVIASLWPIVAGTPLVLQCNVTINVTNQAPQTYVHWVRYDPQVATECNKLNVKLFAMSDSGERSQISYTPGLDMNMYAHELDPKYKHFILNINGEETTLDSEEQISWRSVLGLDEEL